MKKDYSVRSGFETLRAGLQDYLEAQYHIRHPELVKERQCLLEKSGSIYKEPYLESTPYYESTSGYSEIKIPGFLKEMFENFSGATHEVGIFPRPFIHQKTALESFFGSDTNIIIATGTGSGKTESFLMPILGHLALETQKKSRGKSKPGMRALLLYPMNALVNDQLGRIRRMFGADIVAEWFQKHEKGRPVRFGTYTGRTPYPGQRERAKDKSHLDPLFEDFYLPNMNNPQFVESFRDKGKWPSKDLEAFYGDAATEPKDRYLTNEDDRELLTRHEIQLFCPDLVVTNYSMLEYMLLRPIEAQIFEQTKDWLASDSDNQLILILDEAHLYRGTTGAEVAFLIRRLRSRIGAHGKKMRCIMTSASLGEGVEAEEAILKFASELTGLEKFELIRGQKEKRGGVAVGDADIANALSQLNVQELYETNLVSPSATAELAKLQALRKKASAPVQIQAKIQSWIYESLEGFGPFEKLVEIISGKAVEFSKLHSMIFPGVDRPVADRAIENLVALGTLAKREKDGRILLPTRLHLFFRGIPGYFACINPKCELQLAKSVSPILGRGYLESRAQCDCSLHGRVFEVLTHRDCGAAYIRVFAKISDSQKFLWHEPTSQVGREDVEGLVEIHLLVEGEVHPRMIDEVRPAFVEITTGYLQYEDPVGNDEKYLKVFVRKTADPDESGVRPVFSFGKCPCCTKGRKNNNKIMDLATKGEAPFANLVRNQMLIQPPRHAQDDLHPNGGRKVLLFSDGRQKAARLALDIPREVEQDSFRQVLVLAVKALEGLQREAIVSDYLYKAFIAEASKHHIDFFDSDDQKTFRVHKKNFKEYHDGNLGDLLGASESYPPVGQYRTNLFRELCKESYSVESTTVAVVALSKKKLKALHAELAKDLPGKFSLDDVAAASKMMIDEFLYSGSFDKTLPGSARIDVIPYPKHGWGHKDSFSKTYAKVVKEIFGIDDAELRILELGILKFVGEEGEGGSFLNSNSISIRVKDDTETWVYCKDCSLIAAMPARNKCIYCGSASIEFKNPNDDVYIQARKAHWRNPLIMCLRGEENPFHLTAEEHTAQLGNKDAGQIFSTTEKYELRFQDIGISDKEPAIDVLSCTTTMEVGVDIGSLVAVGLRNVPPLRENYQQRAGRAGRRGSSISTVVTFAQGGPHDSFYFNNPEDIVAGDPRLPRVKTDNLKIASRHLNAYFLQSYFHEKSGLAKDPLRKMTSDFSTALGLLTNFMEAGKGVSINYLDFQAWVKQRIADGTDIKEVENWHSADVKFDRKAWVIAEAGHLIAKIADEWIKFKVENREQSKVIVSETLLDFLFDRGLLPKYAFPTDLACFLVETRDGDEVVVKQKPQLSMARALSEYAPGRLVVIDKKKYLSGGVGSTTLTSVVDRAEALFKSGLQNYTYCIQCSFVSDPKAAAQPEVCPICSGEIRKAGMIVPSVFSPDYDESTSGQNIEQELTYATAAQFPVPVDDAYKNWTKLSSNAELTYAQDRKLVVANKGKRGKEEGFLVCGSCGKSAPKSADVNTGPHKRPYLVDTRFRRGIGEYCNGEFKNVFLGHTFVSDLLLIHLDLKKPLRTGMADSLTRHVLEDSLRSLSEALLLGATKLLQIDPSEVSVGYRFLPAKADGKPGEIGAEIYIYDTLAGGAAYSDQIGEQIQAVIQCTLNLLRKCPGDCDRSCYQCLRNYGNRIWHESLDRSLAESMLVYMMGLEQARFVDDVTTAKQLDPLSRYFELKGYTCAVNGNKGKFLSVSKGEKSISIEVIKAIYEESKVETRVSGAIPLNEYFLTRNLPGAGVSVEKYFR
jgi:ATP-dependent helicase YprA (DUF1998 family)